jgi:adenylosuccinate lyase
MIPNYDTYLSPFTWRYGSPEMRRIWSEVNKRLLWRKIWVALAEVQVEWGLVRPEQLDDLNVHISDVDIQRSFEIEADIHHDLMAELMVFAEQSRLGGGILHLGATSMDIEDNAEVLRVRQSLDLIIHNLRQLLSSLINRIDAWADTPLIAFTHLQPAEPTTLGYRMSLYAQDLLLDWEDIRRARRHLRGKGFKGAVGSGASYADLIGKDQLAKFEMRLSTNLRLPFFPVASQTYPRKQDYQVIAALAGLGGSLYKFAFDLRILQSPPIGEMAEPFHTKQVGSSAMPFKRNPINAEKIDSLGRFLAQLPRLAWDNAAHSLLERTLDDSANRRSLLPEAFLAADEILNTANGIVTDLQVNTLNIQRNLAEYGPFAATERVLMALTKAGADRQVMHARLREHALRAWQMTGENRGNPLVQLVVNDDIFLEYLSAETIHTLMDATRYIGDAPQRARAFADQIRIAIEVS